MNNTKINPEDSDTRLQELCRQRLSSRRLILASNRGPVEYYFDKGQSLCSRRGSGGVVTALSSLSKYVELDWIASAMGQGDREVARRAEGKRFSVLENDNLHLRFVVCSRNTYHKFYSVICNPLLWFLQHYMWNSPNTPNIDIVVHDAWENGYVQVNQAFAKAIVEEAMRSELPPIVILNDYHLYLTGGYIRRQLPELVIEHFIHIPWPSPCYWELLPNSMRQAIFRSLCDADIVGLQTIRDVHSFLHGCESFINEAEVDYHQHNVRLGNHLVQVKAYPISIDVTGLKKAISSPEVQEYERKLRPLCGESTIVRVDRAEPSKNIIRGFKAFDKLLERHPQFRGKVKFIAFLVPTRTHLKLYRRYMQETTQLIEAINSKYGTEQWYPIDFFYENNYLQAIAGMRLYDILLVNAVIDGMNLVAKEGPTVNHRNGVLILSETVGAYEQLGANALMVSPTDLEGTTEALYAALMMPLDERKQRATALRESIEKEDIIHWLQLLLEDAVSLIEQCSPSTT
ncbi:MAG: trehalose-6-phosphate synthase [Dehalococcoidales bacterium]|nr:trehalose-6-phosphate synthase [Dehalococcoidales bacterium]